MDDNDYSEKYAGIYDFITSHKNYTAEVDALVRLVESNLDKGEKSILSVGCGTGAHEILLGERGYRVFGIDNSRYMINNALEKKRPESVGFGNQIGDEKFFLGEQIDCVISLFNVINCVENLSGLEMFFSTVISRIRDGGIFIFEAWNGSECMFNPPTVVSRSYKESSSRSSLTRIATPHLYRGEQRLTIDYKIEGVFCGEDINFESVHEITLFTIREISYLLQKVGFSELKMFNALPDLKGIDENNKEPARMLAFSVRKKV
jgi:SAM-dependent methyltransferase